MKKNNPYWKKRKPKADQAEKKGFFKKLYEAFESKTISGIVFLVSTLFLFGLVYLIGYTNAGDWYRKIDDKQKDLTMMKHYPVEGRVVNCDSVPIPGLTVAVQGYDVESTKTDINGFFSAYLTLPAALEVVPIRFIDSTNQEIYTTLYALKKNELEGSLILVYTIPEQKFTD